MKKNRYLWIIMLMMSWLTALTGCSPKDEDALSVNEWSRQGLTLTRELGKQDSKIVIELFERNGIKLHLIDITERFDKAQFYGQSVPVTYIELEKLPAAIQPIVKVNGRNGAVVKVFRFEYQEEFYYEVSSLFQNTIFNIYNSRGERCEFNSDYVNEIKGACCILVLDVEIVKNAEGAPNYLVGIWKNDWQHVKYHDDDAVVTLYPELPFSITEVMRLNEDYTGYLRTIKCYQNGNKEIALDPFRYELTDYHGGEQYGYHGYSYKCYFEAGDVIEYMERSYDSMQTLEYIRNVAYFPWYKQSEDQFESLEVNVGQKYGLPANDSKSPIVGRWEGGEYSEMLMQFISTTWVFRSDNTGYRLLGEQYNAPFAYTVSYNGSNAEIIIYEYNVGFTLDEGFVKNYTDISDPMNLPKGVIIKAKVNGNSLEMDGWGSFYRQ